MSFSLYLHPRNPDARIDPHVLLHSLSEIGLLGEGSGPDRLLPGERLMEFITYLGCSPALSSGGVEASVKLHALDTPAWLGGEAVDRLRYPDCGHAIDSGSALISAGDPWRCPTCGNSGKLEAIAWRRSAARACLFIELSPIFPREAVPSDALLERLESATGESWRWFYSRSTQDDSL